MDSLRLMADALDAFLTAHKQALDPYATVFAVADEKTLETTVQQVQSGVPPR